MDRIDSNVHSERSAESTQQGSGSSTRTSSVATNMGGLKSYGFLTQTDDDKSDGSPDDETNAQRSSKIDQCEQPFAETVHLAVVNFGDENGEQEGKYVNQFGEISRSTSEKLFRGGNGSVTSLSSLVQLPLSERGSVVSSNDDNSIPAKDAHENVQNEILNQFGCVQRVESCVLFGVDDEVKETAKNMEEASISKQLSSDKNSNECEAVKLGDGEEKVCVDFGDDETPKEKYMNQFGEPARRTSYKLFRGAGGSANSLTSLNQFGGSELGSLGSVCEMNALVDDEIPSPETKRHAPVEEVMNQFGHIARKESAALFRSDSASSLALSGTDTAISANDDDLDGDFF